MKKVLALFTLIVLCAVTFAPTAPSKASNLAPTQDDDKLNGKLLRKGAQKIPGQYIVVFEEFATGRTGRFSMAAELSGFMTSVYGGKVKHVYQHALNGYAAEMSEEAALALSKDSRVAFVEEDSIMHTTVTQNNATWGLDRIDQRALPLSTTYTHNFTGAGVHAYIIDTGIRTTHTQFGGRASVGFDAVGGNGQDCNGHGTHVAGTVGSSTFGVAKGVILHAVRVLGCNGSGSNSGVIAGVNWVRQNRIRPAVANMSLGGGPSAALDAAVNSAVAAGVTFAVAAGNSNQNACNFSPARAANALTVGSTTRTDARSSFSNFGTCVDIFAPGSGITSTWSTSNTATNTISGTSMASPHVAGVAALYLQGHTSATPAAVRTAMVNASTPNRVTNAGAGSPNRLLYSLIP